MRKFRDPQTLTLSEAQSEVKRAVHASFRPDSCPDAPSRFGMLLYAAKCWQRQASLSLEAVVGADEETADGIVIECQTSEQLVTSGYVAAINAGMQTCPDPMMMAGIMVDVIGHALVVSNPETREALNRLSKIGDEMMRDAGIDPNSPPDIGKNPPATIDGEGAKADYKPDSNPKKDNVIRMPFGFHPN